MPFHFEHKLRARHSGGVAARLRPSSRYHRSDAPTQDHAPFPTTLFVVDAEEVAETHDSTASGNVIMPSPILVSSREALSGKGYCARPGDLCGISSAHPWHCGNREPKRSAACAGPCGGMSTDTASYIRRAVLGQFRRATESRDAPFGWISGRKRAVASVDRSGIVFFNCEESRQNSRG